MPPNRGLIEVVSLGYRLVSLSLGYPDSRPALFCLKFHPIAKALENLSLWEGLKEFPSPFQNKELELEDLCPTRIVSDHNSAASLPPSSPVSCCNYNWTCT